MYAVVGKHLLPQHAVDAAEAVGARYADLDLQYVPEEMRANPTTPPFALINTQTGDLIRYFKEDECNTNFVLRWLYENDTQRHGEKALWDKFVAQVDAEKKEREKKEGDVIEEKAEFLGAVASSPLHTYRHNGVKIG